MVFDVHIALTWILFLALFPISFFWLRRTYRILIKRDFSEVALKRGEPPPNAEKFAPYTATLNLVCGAITVWVIIAVGLGLFAYETWSATAGITIWSKFIGDFIISRHAHPIMLKKKVDAVDPEKAAK
jgi:amino acid transporter